MYTIYGSTNSCQCSMVKRLFNENGLEYNYVDIKDAPEIKQKATDKGIKQLPIVVNANTQEIVDPWKVIHNA